MVERFIAPVLKTGDPLRGPGVRIPLPLHKWTHDESYRVHFFYALAEGVDQDLRIFRLGKIN